MLEILFYVVVVAIYFMIGVRITLPTTFILYACMENAYRGEVCTSRPDADFGSVLKRLRSWPKVALYAAGTINMLLWPIWLLFAVGMLVANYITVAKQSTNI